MSIFTRPDSPPPRQPSPDLVPAPLPCPPPRNRSSVISERACASTPQTPPGLHPTTPGRRHLAATRSFDDIGKQRIKPRSSYNSLQDVYPPRNRARSSKLSVNSEPSRPSSSGSSTFQPRHHRSLSVVQPRSHLPTTEDSAVPPVPTLQPALPGVVRPVDFKADGCPQTLITPIYIPDLEQLSPMSELPLPLPLGQQKSSSSPEKHKDVGITCFKFFTLRNASRKASKIFAF